MRIGDTKKVMDYMMDLNKNGKLSTYEWKTTGKSLIYCNDNGKRVIVPLKNILGDK